MMENDALKEGERFFRQECRFVAAAEEPNRIPPPSFGEIAFAGRSNVGKSSLINALTGRKGLARASNTPGRTQQIIFFALGDRAFLVDLPGYGYAQAAKEKVHAWNDMVQGYLRARQTLKVVCMLVDARHGLKDVDLETMAMLDHDRVPYAIVLTKADKIKKTEADELVRTIEANLKKHPSAHPLAFLTSSEKKEGIAELRLFLAKILS